MEFFKKRYHMPPMESMVMQHFFDLFSGHKLGLDKNTVKIIKVERFAELTTKMVLDQVLKDEKCFKYIPDKWAENSYGL